MVRTELMDKAAPTRLRRVAGPQDRPVRQYPTVLTAALAALWAMSAGALAVVALVLVGWLVDGRTGAGAGEAARIGLQAFLLAHGSSLTVDWGTLGLVPLGLTLLPGWLLMRAGASVARRRPVKTLRQIAEVVAAITVVYAVLAALLATLASSTAASAVPLRAGAGAAVLAAVTSALGVLRVSGLGRLPITAIAGPRRAVAAAVAAGGLVLAAGGAVALAIALSVDIGRYGELSRAVAPTWTGAVGLALVGLLLLPNAVLFAASAGVGPGFSVGAGTVVGAFDVHLDTVPAFPMLAALPDGGQPPVAVLLIPLLAGLAIGLTLVRRLDAEDARGPVGAALWAGVAGVLTGALIGAASYAAGGPLGGGQLAAIGPSGWLVGCFAAAELALVAAATAGTLRWWSRRG